MAREKGSEEVVMLCAYFDTDMHFFKNSNLCCAPAPVSLCFWECVYTCYLKLQLFYNFTCNRNVCEKYLH